MRSPSRIKQKEISPVKRVSLPESLPCAKGGLSSPYNTPKRFPCGVPSPFLARKGIRTQGSPKGQTKTKRHTCWCALLFPCPKGYSHSVRRFAPLCLTSQLDGSAGRMRTFTCFARKVRPRGRQKPSGTPVGVPLGFWPARKDSNLRPSESESDALSSCATGRYSIF